MITLVVFILFSFFALSSTYSVNMYQHGLKDPEGDEFLSKHLPGEEWFTQKLDHFNTADEHTWSQRYWVNSTFHVAGGPAFLMIGGEASASPLWTLVGQWISFAEENNALCFLLEHRFYGESKPVDNTSMENLKYLNSQQALADLAYFITSMNEKYGSSINKWIVFGGSYSGTLASWLRLKYPHLVFGAVSSSGPVKAKVDLYEYFEVVQASLASYKKECVEEVRKANIELSNFVKTEDGRSKITKKFLLCENLKDDEDDISTLFGSLAGHFGDVVQYNKDNVGKHLSKLTIDVFCDIMTTQKSSEETSLDRYADVNKYWLSVNDYSCISNDFQGYIKYLKPNGWSNGRQWLYQTCTEFGYFHTSSKETNLFGPHFPVKFIIKPCEKVLGLKFNEQFLENAVKRTNIFYGALDINVGNIIFVNGSIDPYHSVGITEVAPDKPYEVIYIEGSAHCADAYPSSPEDSVQLIEARNKIRSIIKSWLSDDKMRS